MLAGTVPGSHNVPEHSHVVWPGHVGKLEVNGLSSSSWKHCARTRARGLRWILQGWQLLSSSACGVGAVRREPRGGPLGSWDICNRDTEIRDPRAGQARSFRAESVHAGEIMLLEPQIRSWIVPPIVQATPPLYLQLLLDLTGVLVDAGSLTDQHPNHRAAHPMAQVWVPGSPFALLFSGMV